MADPISLLTAQIEQAGLLAPLSSRLSARADSRAEIELNMAEAGMILAASAQPAWDGLRLRFGRADIP